MLCINTNAIQGLKNESHADTSIYKKERGTISYPTFEVPGMTHNNKIRNAHAIRADICSLILVTVLLLPGFRTFQIK